MSSDQLMGSHIVEYPGYGNFKIYGGNEILKFRAQTFLTKEPTTLEWLQSLEADSLLIDVGANIGIYAMPAALFHVKKVIAIEPEIKNYNMLLDNLAANNISLEKCEALPLAISTQFKNQFTRLYLTKDEVGASCHQVGNNQDFKLRPLDGDRQYRNIYCASLAQIVEQTSRDHDGPIHVKVDVDGIEADVCRSLFDDGMISRVSSFQIELNDSIDEHCELIELLNCVGFYFDDDQVKRARRQSGDFKGFAEYVFRRCMSDAMISLFPDQVVSRLGCQLERSFPMVKPDVAGYFFENSSPTLVNYSRLPASFILKNLFDHVKCSGLFHDLSSKILSNTPRSTNFIPLGGKKQEQSLRYQVDIDLIKTVAPEYVKELNSLVKGTTMMESVLKAVAYAVRLSGIQSHDTDRNSNQDLRGKRLIARVRHFIDLWGYSLSRHHDSSDTLCALIVPIFPYSTSTSIVCGSPIDRQYASQIHLEDLQPDVFRRDMYYATTSQYPQTLSFLRRHQPSDGIHDISGEWSLDGLPYTFSSVDLRPGEGLLLPNLLCEMISRKDSLESRALDNFLMEHCGHGILPSVRDMYRPVLLLDYMFVDSSELNFIQKTADLFIDYGSASAFIDRLLKR